MLSYEEIGAAAMLSRACAGTIGTTARSSALPGSEHAVRLAMTKLILPELGHVVRELAADDERCGRSARRFPLDEARALPDRGGVPDRANRARRDPSTRTDACSPTPRDRARRRPAVRPRRDGRLRGASPKTRSAPAATSRRILRCDRERSSPARWPTRARRRAASASRSRPARRCRTAPTRS